ncbi:MAG: urea amidolyase related protein [Frankiales bacterium]|nr:urea amidolyase related protein [Frankiales bacterium]
MIEILATGPLATVQDLGRRGHTALGVSRSGAADQDAHRFANRLVGNDDDAATIEFTLGGAAFRLHRAATIAITGPPCPLSAVASRGRIHPIATGETATLPAGTVVRLSVPATGVRNYLAVRGGFDVPPVLGSRSTDCLSGLGPDPLRPAQLLAIGPPGPDNPQWTPGPAFRRPAAVRVVLGPHADWLAPGAIEILTQASWTVRPTSDRVGVRLAGPGLVRTARGEIPSEPTLPGAIQVPPDGQPIVLGPDAPVTGGYPVVAVVHRADLPLLAQARPGDEIRFAATTHSAA